MEDDDLNSYRNIFLGQEVVLLTKQHFRLFGVAHEDLKYRATGLDRDIQNGANLVNVTKDDANLQVEALRQYVLFGGNHLLEILPTVVKSLQPLQNTKTHT